MLQLFYKFIWSLCQFLATAYEILCCVNLRLHALAAWSYDHCRSKEKLQQLEHDLFERCKRELSKIPKHLSLIIGSDDKYVDEEVLRRAFSYAYTMDIEYVSIYDARQSDKWCTMLEKLKVPKGIEFVSTQQNRFVWRACTVDDDLCKTMKNGYANGETNGTVNGVLTNKSKSDEKTMQIYQIQADENHQLIGEICRELYVRRKTDEMQVVLKDRQLLHDRINGELIKRLGITIDPELAIVFSKETCTFGFLPWQIRFTEFQRLDSGTYFNAQTFARVLYKYARCEQRWGT